MHYLDLVRYTTTAPPKEGGEKQFFRRRAGGPAGRRAVTHMCFMYGAHIMHGASTFAASGAVTNERNSFSAGGPAGRDAQMFYVRSTHNVRGEKICRIGTSYK